MNARHATAKEFFEGDVQRVVAQLHGSRGKVEFDIQGKGGGAWLVDLETNEVKPTRPGEANPVACIIRADARDFLALVEGRMSPADGLVTERLHVAGDAAMIGRLWRALEAARAS